MNLKTLRFVLKTSQLLLEKQSGVYQTRLSKAENGWLTLTNAEKESIEKYYGVPIDWKISKNDPCLTVHEKKEIQPMIDYVLDRDKDRAGEWFARFKTHRELYNKCMQIYDQAFYYVQNYNHGENKC